MSEQEMREAFEGWALEVDHLDIAIDDDGFYASSNTNSAWAAWQAATLAAEARIRRLEEALTAIGNMTYDTWTNGHEAGTIARAALTEHKEQP